MSRPVVDPVARQELRRRIRLERWATVLAHVMHFGADRAREVVARFALDLDTWNAIDEAWSSELAEAYRRQQNQQAARFASAFLRARSDLALRSPPLSAIGDEARPATAAAAPVDGAPHRVAASFQLTPVAAPPAAVLPPAMPSPMLPAISFDALPKQEAPSSKRSRTAELRESKVRGARGKEIPFARSEEAIPISLEAYARITVRLARREERGTVLTELKLDETTWLKAARSWSDRLRVDEGLMQAYIEMVGRLKAELGGA